MGSFNKEQLPTLFEAQEALANIGHIGIALEKLPYSEALLALKRLAEVEETLTRYTHIVPQFSEEPAAAKPKVPAYHPGALVNWRNAHEATQAFKDGFLPKGHSIADDGALIAPRWRDEGQRTSSSFYALFSEIRDYDGVVIKSRHAVGSDGKCEECEKPQQPAPERIGPVVKWLRLNPAGYEVFKKLLKKDE